MFERDDRVGGLLRYGIPEFKLEKKVLDRRLEQMRVEGVQFKTNACVGGNIPLETLRNDYDALLLTAAPARAAGCPSRAMN